MKRVTKQQLQYWCSKRKRKRERRKGRQTEKVEVQDTETREGDENGEKQGEVGKGGEKIEAREKDANGREKEKVVRLIESARPSLCCSARLSVSCPSIVS